MAQRLSELERWRVAELAAEGWTALAVGCVLAHDCPIRSASECRTHAGRQAPNNLGATTSQTNVRALNVAPTINTVVDPNNNTITYSLAVMASLRQEADGPP